jgi:two-component system chemotaxis response regulator CheY
VRALIVDDSRATRSIIGKILQEIGFDTFEAGHGKEGLDRLKEFGCPDIVLVESNMPEMNGDDFVCAARATPEYSNVPLMMVTSETQISQMARALEAGANEYVMKPFTKEVIADKITILGVMP